MQVTAASEASPKAMHVLHAPLRVMQEAAYVSDGAFGFLAADADEAVKAMCEGADPDARREADALFERIVLPVLEREVNESPEYSKLRAAYLWRVVGESYRSGLVGDDEDEDGDAEDADEDARGMRGRRRARVTPPGWRTLRARWTRELGDVRTRATVGPRVKFSSRTRRARRGASFT